MPSDTTPWTLVTGATAGMGEALVARLAAQGSNVIAAARDPARVRIPNGRGRVEAVRLDLTEPSTVEAAARDVARIVGDVGLKGLVNMAGIIVEGPLEGLPASALRRQFEVNVFGPVALAQALLPLIAHARGAIVNIGTVSFCLAPPFYGPIAASKAALASLNDAMRLEFAPLGIKVFLIRARRDEDRHIRDRKSGARCVACRTAGPRAALSTGPRRHGSRFRKSGCRRPRGRHQGSDGGFDRPRRQPQDRSWQGDGRLLVLVAAASPPPRSACQVGAWAEQRSQAR